MTRRANVSSLSRPALAVILCLLGATARQVNAASIQVAEQLLVDLRSNDLAPGAVTTWRNRGSLGGAFTAVGNPLVESVGGWDNVVRLDGQSAYTGPASPAGITGGDTRSIEIWVYNLGESKEECMVSWSHRGGPDGTNMTFNYGWKDFGAAGHWGDDADMAWQGFDNAVGGAGGYPPLETWQYLAYTYDGTTCRVYVNGELNTEKAAALSTHAGNAIRIGAQGNNDGTPTTGEKNFTGAIAQVRIHEGVLTAEQIRNNAQIRTQTPGKASNPSPVDGDMEVPLRDLTLSWQPGEYPGTHTVYFGQDVDAVTGGTAQAVSGVDVNSYDPGRLEFDRTYFWRVDEVNASADKTVHPGPVWSFTVEPFSYKLLSVTAKASSSAKADSGPAKTVDGSGLNASDQHDVTGTNMWMSGIGQQPPVWIQYEFDKVYKLDQMWVWNSNNELESFVGLGVKTATVEYSTDGVTWAALANVPQFAQAPGAPGYAHNTTVDFGGVAARFVKMTFTSNWGGRDQYGLSEVRFFYIPVVARDPNPPTGAAGVPIDTTLRWKAGRQAASHEIHFGMDKQAVTDSTTPLATVSQAAYAPANLQLDTTYYWKVIEVNQADSPSAWDGEVWSFSTPRYLIVDDFESYTDASPQRVFQTWIDGLGFSADAFFPNGNTGNGTGSFVGYDPAAGPIMERTIIHGGRQSMPFAYNGLSEATRTFDVAQDWTRGGIKTLVLFFRGDATNTPGELYVKINGAKAAYPGNAGDLAAAAWKQWNVNLPSSAGLGAVKTLTIGVSAGQGTLYIDDIALYRSAPAVSP